jgi:hypothetical protein
MRHVEPTTRRAPLDMTLDQFLERMMVLEQLVVEALGERFLRQLAQALS